MAEKTHIYTVFSDCSKKRGSLKLADGDKK